MKIDGVRLVYEDVVCLASTRAKSKRKASTVVPRQEGSHACGYDLLFCFFFCDVSPVPHLIEEGGDWGHLLLVQGGQILEQFDDRREPWCVTIGYIQAIVVLCIFFEEYVVDKRASWLRAIGEGGRMELASQYRLTILLHTHLLVPTSVRDNWVVSCKRRRTK